MATRPDTHDHDDAPIHIPVRTILTIVGILILLAAAYDSFYVTNAGERVVTFNKISGNLQTHDQGLNFKAPFLVSKTRYTVRGALWDTDADAASSDLQDAHTHVAIKYRIAPENVADVHQRYGPDYGDVVIGPAVQGLLKSATAHYTAEQLITNRTGVTDEFSRAITARLASDDIEVLSVDVTNFRFSDEFTKSIEAKAQAAQDAEREHNNVLRAQYLAQQREVNASATYNVTVTEARGTADAAKLIQDAIQQSPSYLEFLRIQKWTGTVPTYYVAGGNGTAPAAAFVIPGMP